MNIHDLQRHWDAFGRKDPLWAILTRPEKKNRQWDIGEFFETGRIEIAGVMLDAEKLGLPLRRDRALDFGCGVGRLTQALCAYFDTCHGVDIAPSMIKIANDYNQYGEKCNYHVNSREDLSLFESDYFDLIYSQAVLQHMNIVYAKMYLREFARIIRRGGLIVVQIPSRKSPPIPEGSLASGNERTDQTPRTGSNVPHRLAGRAMKAVITAIDRMTVEPGSETTIVAHVRNASDAVWQVVEQSTGEYSIGLGNHWLDKEGNMLMHDDGRSYLTANLRPSEETELTIVVNAPIHPGQYLLELDVLQEGHAWFKGRGSETKRIVVDVVASQNSSVPSSTPTEWQSPVMEMHTIDIPEVIDLFTSCGCEIVKIEESSWLEWNNVVYFVTRR